MDLFEKVSEDIKTAMKAKDKVALETLRNVKKVFLEAKTAPGANDTLSDADALKIIQKLTKQGKDAAEIYVQQGRQDLADDELAQVKVLENLSAQADERRRTGGSLEGNHSRSRRHQRQGHGQGDGCSQQETCRTCRRPRHLSQSKRVAGIKKYTSPII